MPRSPVPHLILDALASDPDRAEPYTTTEVRDWVARAGCPVTRDTIAHHLRLFATASPHRGGKVKWAGKVSGAARVGGGEHLWEMTPAGWVARRRAVEAAEASRRSAPT